MGAASPMHVARVEVSWDGTLGCLISTRDVMTLRLPSLEREAEVGIDDDAGVAVVGEPPRIVVLSSAGVLHVVDPRGKDGPKKVGELTIEPGTHIVTATANHLFVTTPGGPAIIALTGSRPLLTRISLRGAIAAAGACATPDHFVVSVGGVVEEWSAELRAPLRRFRLERPVVARHIGGNARHIWLVVDTAPSDLILVPLASARPARIELPEPVAKAVGDRTASQLAVVGKTTGSVFLVNLVDRSVRSIHPGPVDDVAWVGTAAVLTANQSMLGLTTILAVKDGAPASSAEPAESAEARRLLQPMSTSERLAAWKERARNREAREPAAAGPAGAGVVPEPGAASLEYVTPAYEWRDAVALWARRRIAGAQVDPPLLAAGPLHDVGIRLGLSADEGLVLWLVYGARICGHDGVAPVDIAVIAPQGWKDALGQSRLRALGVFRWRRNRVDLMREVGDALDDLPPVFGTVIESSIALTPAVAVVAPPEPDLVALGGWAAPRLGSLLVPNRRGLRAPARLLVEARVRGLAPLIPAACLPGPRAPDHAVVVVEDAAVARGLGLEALFIWSAASSELAGAS